MCKNKKQIISIIFPYIISAIFLIISIILIINHEFWADEMRAWNISSSSLSISELIYNLRLGEGHPYLWYFLLYFISHFLTDNPEAMKVLHLTISVVTTLLILKFAPFNKIIRVMVVFSYFFFYEYSIISRNYSIAILCMIIFCILYKNKYKNLISISIVLLLMGQVNIYSFMISIALFLFLVWEIFLERKNIENKLNKFIFPIFILIAMGSIMLIYWQLGSQLRGNAINSSIFSIFKRMLLGGNTEALTKIPEMFVKSYLPLPKFNLNFWETNSITTFLSSINVILVYLLGALLFIIPLFFLKRKILFIYLIGNLSIILVPVFIYKFSLLRHYGHHFILLIVCVWISCLKPEEKYLISSKKTFYPKLMNSFLVICLAFSLIGSGVAYYFDYRYAFSSAKKAANYIQNEYNLNDLVIIGYHFHPSETIAGYLNKELYYPYSLKENKFSKSLSWPYMKWPFDIYLPIQSAYNFLLEEKETLLIIAGASDNDKNVLKMLGFKKIEKDFSHAIVSWEDFSLYKFENNMEIIKLSPVNFQKNWKNFRNCENQIIDNKVFIKSLSDDPSFESNFQIPPLSESDKLLIRIGIETTVGCDLEIHYKRKNSSYSANDLNTKKIVAGYNDILIEVEDLKNLESFRIDPVNIKNDCFIDKIEIYRISKKH